MPINFFDESCQEKHITSTEFGICDDQEGERAYVDRANRSTWVATVVNTGMDEITFTAIDNCIDILRNNGEMESRCDGMLNTKDQIVFVELKDQRASWIADAVKQLETTIRYFIESHDISAFRHKQAFACNRRHPHFQVLDNAQKQQFYNTFKVRLNVQATIVIG